MVPRAVENYESLKRQGVVTVFNFGVPILDGPHVAATWTTGSRRSTPAPAAATRSTARSGPTSFPARVLLVAGRRGVEVPQGQRREKGREDRLSCSSTTRPVARASPMVEAIARKEGYLGPPLRRAAARPRNRSRRSNDDHPRLQGRLGHRQPVRRAAPGVHQGAQRAGYPMNRVAGFVCGSGDADVDAAGWDVAQGYLGLQCATHRARPPVIQEIIQMYRARGQGRADVRRQRLLQPRRDERLLSSSRRSASPSRTTACPLTGDKVRRGWKRSETSTPRSFAPPITHHAARTTRAAAT